MMVAEKDCKEKLETRCRLLSDCWSVKSPCSAVLVVQNVHFVHLFTIGPPGSTGCVWLAPLLLALVYDMMVVMHV